MNFSNDNIIHNTDICVIGGGMAGLCAAISAARHGAKVVLIHDRPVLGGNASSEIRMWIRGAVGKNNRETGLLQEIEFENIYRNPTMNYSLWDSVLYEKVIGEKNIELLLNCSCLGCETDNGKISNVLAWQLTSYTFHKVYASYFIDCSGDSILASLSLAEYRIGREGKNEFDEYGAPDKADNFTMGSSVLLEARETDHYCEFIAPKWAKKYPDDESMNLHKHKVSASGTNFWWIEFGGKNDTIKDADLIGDELIKICYGVWDHLKNQSDHGLDNWELEWIGFLPGKRESRRYVGKYILNQRDLENGAHFEDAVAFGGWTMDNHSPLGFYHYGYSSNHIDVKAPYEIPFRSLYSKNVPNLMFAGRNISATHMALSSTRVMATCSLLGQAAGTAGAYAFLNDCTLDEVCTEHIKDVQQQLLTDGCYIPNCKRIISDTMPTGIDSERIKVLRNGFERPNDEESNVIFIKSNERIVFDLEGLSEKTLRVVWDSDFSRESITDVTAYQKFALRSHIAKNVKPLKMPKNLMQSCDLIFTLKDGKKTVNHIENNRNPLLLKNLDNDIIKVEISSVKAWNSEDTGIFACDIVTDM